MVSSVKIIKTIEETVLVEFPLYKKSNTKIAKVTEHFISIIDNGLEKRITKHDITPALISSVYSWDDSNEDEFKNAASIFINDIE